MIRFGGKFAGRRGEFSRFFVFAFAIASLIFTSSLLDRKSGEIWNSGPRSWCIADNGLHRIIKLADLDADEFLKSGWTQDCIDGVVIEMLVESITDTWTAQQVWGMCDINGERRQVRKVLTKKGSKEHKISIVYDYVSK